jgi:hypothetical protein
MISTLLSKVKFNPVLVAAVLVAVGAAVEAGEVTNWESLGAIVLGVVVRQFVTPVKRAEASAESAFYDGLQAGRENGVPLNGPI